MTKKEQFIYVVEELIKKVDLKEFCQDENLYSGFNIYFDSLKQTKDKEKVVLTDNGKIILKFMQTEKSSGSSKAIAEELGVSSRSVSGSMRKLEADGFVEKIGEDPIVYLITEKGKEINID